jgi:hypothetical protein
MRITRTIASVCCAGALAAGIMTGCGKKEQAAAKSVPAGQEQTAPAKTFAACMYDGISLKQEPSKNGKWLASISLGEMVQSLGDSAVDTADKNRCYQKIQLSDGKSGWATSYGLVLNARLAAVKQATLIYKRPDLLTGTDVKIGLMNPVAVIQEKDGWSEFISEARKKSGWIRSDALTAEPADVAVAILALKKLGAAKNRAEAVKEFISASPYPESFFIKKLQEETDAATATAEPAASAADTTAESD